MHCPVCNDPETRVLDTRLSQDGTSIRRRRQCDHCEYRFSTLEEIELLNFTIVKRNGSREVYDRDKLERGLRRALEKRPHTASDFRGLVHAIERDLQRIDSTEVRSQSIGEVVMDNLKSFDKVAYIRFASVYRSFEDVDTFQKELDRLRASKSKSKKTGKK
ncbi:transcriptional regulator NrdR [Candidatus Uhrbacteria bacterium]|nr:transcriptional regulator NrdR [Candidatus Uhrbacteria bacterium]